MRRSLLGLVVALSFSVLAPASRAQGFGNFNDPFTFYYGYYLPHQAAIAAQPTPMDTLNAITAARQFNAPTNRNGMFDPVSPYGADESDLFAPGARASGRARPSSRSSFTLNSNARGTGPALYYERSAGYFPTMRPGRGPNRNLTVISPRRGGSDGGDLDAQRARGFLRGAKNGSGPPAHRDFASSGGFHLHGGSQSFETDPRNEV